MDTNDKINSESGKIVLELRDVWRSFDSGNQKLEVLRGVNFTLNAGKWCCIYGASGSGKTTLMNLIGALEKPDSGEISVNGVDIVNMNRRVAANFRAKKIGFVFQAYHLLPELTALENVALSARLSGVSAREAEKRAMELLAKMGLADRMSHRPVEMSGGEQQRTAIARALINQPDLLLADEPTGNLDAETGKHVLDLFRQILNDNPHCSILMITHNREIAKISDFAYELFAGILKPVEDFA